MGDGTVKQGGGLVSNMVPDKAYVVLKESAALFQKLNAISATESGYDLLVMLSGNGSDIIKAAAKSACGVQKDRARAFLSTMLGTKEGAALVAKVIEITGV